MTPHAAAIALDLPANASPDQVEARFLELRAKLEDKIAKAPTPGLKEKYRANLEEITTAFETLTLSADSSALPVLNKESGNRSQEQGVKPTQNVAPSSGPSTPDSRPSASAKKSGGKEFVLVAVIAVVVLGTGGWWVMKTKAENEEKARVAAEAKAEAERQAQFAKEQAERDRLAKEAAEKAEKERAERLFTALRSRMAELNVAYDALLRTEQLAERELAELKSQQRDAARGAPVYSQQPQRLAAEVRVFETHVAWLRELLPANPAKVARAQAEELLSARAADEAAGKVEDYATALAVLRRQLQDAQSQTGEARRRAVESINSSRSKLARDFWQKQVGANPKDEVPAYLLESVHALESDQPVNPAEALLWLQASSDGGDLRAAYFLAVALATAWNTKADQARALEIWRRAADAGHPESMYQMANAYQAGYAGLPKDGASYFLWIRKAAEAGLVKAQMDYAISCYRGLGMTANPEEAVKWWRRAAEKGHGRSMSWLSTAYEEGRGVTKDMALSKEWLLKAIEAGDPRAQSEYGTAHWNGAAGFPRDDAKAVEYWRKASDGGILVAMTNIAYAYEQGRGVPKDAALALEWRQKAARAGLETAQKYLRERGYSW